MATTNLGSSPHINPLKKQKVITYNGDLAALIREMAPSKPTYLYDSSVLKARARLFLEQFPGDTAYAVKCNPGKHILQTLTKAGVHSFDVASLEEIRQVRKVNPKATLYYMNPIKTPEAIHAAYHDYGVRIFVLDHKDELYKIMRETGLAQDLDLYVRIALPKNKAAQTDFSSKFGADFESAVELLKLARPVSTRLGISFHVGTQSMDADVYARAIAYTRKIIDEAGIEIDSLDVGGGFPETYPDAKPASIPDYFAVIKTALSDNNFDQIHVLCEPGRGMVADCMKLVTRVDLRRNDLLYINDGVYGGLSELAPWQGIQFPHEVVSREVSDEAVEMKPFRLTGPTCDSVDMMNGPFYLPENAKAGDWVLFHKTGAYSNSVRSDFNGLGDADMFQIKRV